MTISMGVGIGDCELTGYGVIQNTCQDEEVMTEPSVSVDRKMSVNRNFQYVILNKR